MIGHSDPWIPQVLTSWSMIFSLRRMDSDLYFDISSPMGLFENQNSQPISAWPSFPLSLGSPRNMRSVGRLSIASGFHAPDGSAGFCCGSRLHAQPDGSVEYVSTLGLPNVYFVAAASC